MHTLFWQLSIDNEVTVNQGEHAGYIHNLVNRQATGAMLHNSVGKYAHTMRPRANAANKDDP